MLKQLIAESASTPPPQYFLQGVFWPENEFCERTSVFLNRKLRITKGRQPRAKKRGAIRWEKTESGFLLFQWFSWEFFFPISPPPQAAYDNDGSPSDEYDLSDPFSQSPIVPSLSVDNPQEK